MSTTRVQATKIVWSLAIVLASATAGVLMEFYDFLIYGFAAATAFPSIFFPRLPPTQGLVLSYLVFGAGFPARLVGAFVFVTLATAQDEGFGSTQHPSSLWP